MHGVAPGEADGSYPGTSLADTPMNDVELARLSRPELEEFQERVKVAIRTTIRANREAKLAATTNVAIATDAALSARDLEQERDA